MQVISELKQAGLTDNELLQIIASNDKTLNAVEANVASIFANKIRPQGANRSCVLCPDEDLQC